MSAILAAMAASLGTWAAACEPRGTVEIAPDGVDAYRALELPPSGFKVVLWWEGDGPENERSAISRLRAGVAVARGLPGVAHKELTLGRTGVPAVLNILEGVCAHLRGLHTGSAPAAASPASCWLLSYRGSEWLKSLAPEAAHYIHQLSFDLPRQLPAKMPLAVAL